MNDLNVAKELAFNVGKVQGLLSRKDVQLYLIEHGVKDSEIKLAIASLEPIRDAFYKQTKDE